MLTECCKDVATEPILQEITGEKLPPSTIQSDDARVDVAARGFWVKGQVAYFDVKVFIAYFDVKVFNPTAKTSLTRPLVQHTKIMNQKKRAYNKRVNQVDQ